MLQGILYDSSGSNGLPAEAVRKTPGVDYPQLYACPLCLDDVRPHPVALADAHLELAASLRTGLQGRAQSSDMKFLRKRGIGLEARQRSGAAD